ncbi:MAG TPA: tripartite tricarboxylate transporter substrate-binding protein [Burkholderiaceae bacterium]|nr:tripartite tricarboxylate transporter substrate-binding protein [Burkholderiaceae bacterium]
MFALCRWIVALLALCVAPQAAAQALDGPLKIVVGYVPGGSSDRAARLLADSLGQRLGVPVLIENRSGGGGRVAARHVKASTAADNVLLLGNPAINVIAPLMLDDVGYDPYEDFVAVSQLTRYELGVAVPHTLPVTALSHLVEWLRANPQRANVGLPALASLPHLLALALGEHAGLRLQPVGYRGSPPLVVDLAGGQLPVAIAALDSLLPLHDAGRVRIVATSGANRSPQTPQIPTLQESGVAVVAEGWQLLFAPAAMPAERIARIGAAVADAMRDPAMQERFRSARMTPVASTPSQAARTLVNERQRWEAAIGAGWPRP